VFPSQNIGGCAVVNFPGQLYAAESNTCCAAKAKKNSDGILFLNVRIYSFRETDE